MYIWQEFILMFFWNILHPSHRTADLQSAQSAPFYQNSLFTSERESQLVFSKRKLSMYFFIRWFSVTKISLHAENLFRYGANRLKSALPLASDDDMLGLRKRDLLYTVYSTLKIMHFM